MRLDGYGELKRVYLGGTGEMYSLHNREGDFLYKPALRKYSSIKEPFRGIVQECAYKVQDIVDPSSAIWCKYIVAGDSSGALQKRIPLMDNARNYYWMGKNETFNEDEINQFMREFVTDYLLYNFDAHGNNFITDVNGVIRGVDKEQSFRYINESEAQVPSVSYNPNERYGESEPIYNKIFRLYRDGKIDIDFGVISYYMGRVEAYDNFEYRKIFEPYCEACNEAFGPSYNVKRTLDKIVERKVNMRSNIEKFFNELTDVRESTLIGKRK